MMRHHSLGEMCVVIHDEASLLYRFDTASPHPPLARGDGGGLKQMTLVCLIICLNLMAVEYHSDVYHLYQIVIAILLISK